MLKTIEKNMNFFECLYHAFVSVGWQALKAKDVAELTGKPIDHVYSYLGRLKKGGFLTTVPGLKPAGYVVYDSGIPLTLKTFVSKARGKCATKKSPSKVEKKKPSVKAVKKMTKTGVYNSIKEAQEARANFIKAMDKIGCEVKIEINLVYPGVIEEMLNTD